MNTKLVRQNKRFDPHSYDPYFELNYGITQELVTLKAELEGKLILDIGAGEVPFGEFYRGLTVDTCDIQQNSSGTVAYIIKPDGPLPFENNSYDVIFIFDVLEHIKDDLFFIQECWRILKGNGRIVCSVPFLYRYHEEPHDYRRYTPSGLKYLFEDVGKFKVEKLKGLGSTPHLCSILLREVSIKIPKYRKVLYKLGIAYLRQIANIREVCSKSPMSYFLIGKKHENFDSN